MKIQQFLISSVLSATIMFGMSYAWHGLVLNDFDKIPYDFTMFLVLSGIVYICISMGLTFILSIAEFNEKKLIKRIITGGAIGFFIHLVVFTIGISFQGNQLKHLMVDFLWQMIEQATGALVIHIVFSIYELKSKMLKPS